MADDGAVDERRLRSDPIARLAHQHLLKPDARVVIVTGAGLSAASGVPVFRGSDPNAIWVQRATSLGTKAAFLRDPLDWYNDFWFPLFSHAYTRCPPNAGHEAIARLANLHAGVTVVTQNIDTLHQSTRERWDVERQLIEVHGRLGLYHCSSDEGVCHLSTETHATAAQLFPPHVSRAIEQADAPIALEVEHVPHCPECGAPCMPLALMFDEDYTSHAFYQMDRAMDAIERCDALVFVGTSFSVTITNLCLAEARKRVLPVFNLNLRDKLNGAGRRYPVYNVLGPAEETLQQLLSIVERERARAAPVPSAAAAALAPPSGPPLEPEPVFPSAPAASVKRPRSPEEEEEQQQPGDGAAVTADADLNMAPAAAPAAPAAAPAPAPSASTAAEPRFALLPTPQLARPLPLELVAVDFQRQQYGRKPHPDVGVEGAIEAGWASLLEAAARTGSSLFNASKLRFAGCGVRPGPKGGQELVLRLGLTDYRAFKCTDANAAVAPRLQRDGEADHGDASAYMSQKLGVSGVVVTADGQVVLIRRSLRGVAVCGGMLDTPGGHPEPANVPGLEAGGGAAMDTDTTAAAVRAELFGSVAAEVTDEVNIPASALGAPQLLGLVRQLQYGGSPSAAFFIPCSLAADDVRACYAAGPKEAAESSELLLIDRAHLASFLRDACDRLTPAAEGALTLFLRLV